MREIRWTDESEEHIWRHQVTPEEVEEAINTRPRLAEPGRNHTEIVYGTTNAGRYLRTVLAEAEDGRSYIVTARTMTPSEQRTFSKNAR